jgi:hypothetical protein
MRGTGRGHRLPAPASRMSPSIRVPSENLRRRPDGQARSGPFAAATQTGHCSNSTVKRNPAQVIVAGLDLAVRNHQ